MGAGSGSSLFMAVAHRVLKFIRNGSPFADANLLFRVTYLKDSKSKAWVEKGRWTGWMAVCGGADLGYRSCCCDLFFAG